MKLVTVAGPPSAGKTSVIIKTVEHFKEENLRIGIIKFDALSTSDNLRYEKINLPIQVGISGNLCPDHFFVSNIEDCVNWGKKHKLDILISESAGLCNRCSPHIQDVLAVSVIDNLSGIHTPQKIGPMLKLADIIVITKGDIVSQAEREVFAFNVKMVNPRADIVFVNGITGQGTFDVSYYIRNSSDIDGLRGSKLRFTMPASLCTYCVGETIIGEEYCRGNVKKMEFKEVAI